MLEKLLLALTITFCLNLFLGVRLPNATKTASSSQMVETSTPQGKALLVLQIEWEEIARILDAITVSTKNDKSVNL